MKWQSAIFDLDGTIIDSMKLWHIEKGGYIERYGLQPPDGLADLLDGMELEACSQYLIDHYLPGVPQQKIIGDIVETMRQHYLTDVQLKPGVADFFRRLRENGVKVCLGTASKKKMVYDVLEHHNIMQYFDCVANTELVARDKHYPDVFLYAAGVVGATVTRSVVFEDAVYAAEAAKSAGFHLVGIDERWSHGTAEEMRPLCDYFVPDYRHIPEDFWK